MGNLFHINRGTSRQKNTIIRYRQSMVQTDSRRSMAQNNPFRYLPGAHQQRVFFIVAQQIRIYKTGTYVGEPYLQALHSRQLLECLDVDVLETFGRRISRGSPSLLCRYRTDDGDMPFALLTEIAVCRINHADKAQHVCLCR